MNQVNELKEKLILANEKLTGKRLLLSKIKEREAINTLQSDIAKILSKLDNAAAEGQLDWFCLKTAIDCNKRLLTL